MAEVTCVDGAVLAVLAVPVRDRDGVPYEWTLRLLLDGEPFGEVGERCRFFLRTAAQAVRAAGPDGPVSSLEAGVRRWAGAALLPDDQAWRSLEPYLPRDRELFAFRSRDPDDVPVEGELRVHLRPERTWVPGVDGARGHWRVDRQAVLEAWGAGGRGVRAVLDEPALAALLEALAGDAH